jgi:hypothetical protein
MRTRTLTALTVINSVLLVVLLFQQFRPAFAANQPDILRGRGLQIVDGQGRVRASISVLEPEKSADSETVLLRLITERGRPTVKIAASEPSTGVMVAGPTNTKATFAILNAGTSTSSLKLSNEDGQEQLVTPAAAAAK